MSQIMFIRIIKKILSQPGSGVKYPRSATRSSKRNEAPAAQTGTLRASWGVAGAVTDNGPTIDSNIWQHGILAPGGGSPIKYGFWLENGTVHMDKRPHVTPAVEETQNWSDRNLDVVVQRIVDELERRTNFDTGGAE